MEGGSSPNLSHNRFSKHAKISPTFPGTITMLPSNNTTSTVPANMNCHPGTGSAVLIPTARPSKGLLREQDQYMPIANVIRIMRRVLPSHAKISDDAKETIQECVSEYISFITGEANDRCQREQRKTVTAEDILWAMEKLGFDDYIEPLTLFLNRYREMESDRSSLRGEPFVIKRMVDFGGPPAQQLGFGGYPPPLPSQALYPMGHPIGVLDPSTLPPHTGGYYGGGGSAINDDVGSSSSSSTSRHQANMAVFDHRYAHFK